MRTLPATMIRLLAPFAPLFSERVFRHAQVLLVGVILAPALLGLISLVTLIAHRQMTEAAGALRQAAWYRKSHPTFADALALVRKELWAQEAFYGSSADDPR